MGSEQQGLSITITSAAAEKIRELLDERAMPALRIFVAGGGCAGYQYGMTFADGADENDAEVECEGVTIVVDQESIPMLDGIEIDYHEEIMKSGFSIHNPNAASSCACGTSFKAGEGGTPRPCS